MRLFIMENDTSIENSELAKQYQDILDRYSKDIQPPKVEEPQTPESTPVETALPVEAPVIIPEPIVAPVPEPVIVPPVVLPPPLPPMPVFETLQTTPPPQSKFFKYLFFVSLFLFLGVASVIAYTLLTSKTNSSGNASPTPSVAQVVPTVVEKFCDVNDKKIKMGESFPAADGCNTCSCGPDLTIVCTLMACESTQSTKVTPTKAVSTKAPVPTKAK